MKYNTKIITKMLVIITSLILVLNSASYISYASDSGDFFAQYSGSTEASWGYKPNCTFTVTKIVNNKFIISLYSSITKWWLTGKILMK